MRAVYLVPDDLPVGVEAALRAEGVGPGDTLVLEAGRPPRAIKNLSHGVSRFLPHCRLLAVRYRPEAEGHHLPADHRLRVIQGGA